MKKIKAKVEGMTCSSCEVLVERRLKKAKGVHKVSVNWKKGDVTIDCDNNVKLENLVKYVEPKGYRLKSKDPIKNPVRSRFIVVDKGRVKEIGAVLIIILGLFYALNYFNLLPEGIAVTENMSYGFVLVIGLVAATSSCLAVSGGLLLAVSSKYVEQNPHLSGYKKFIPHIYFNIGRIVSYTVLGGAIGLLGSMITLSPFVNGIFTVLVSFLMIVLGLQMLKVFPWLDFIQIKMPKSMAHKMYDASNDCQKKEKQYALTFGAATFFLPCGFTQALQLYVLSQGNFVTGAITMFIFSIGTLPSLATIGLVSSFVKGKTQHYFMTTAAMLIILLGAFSIPAGFALAGINLSGEADTSLFVEAQMEGDYQIVDMTVIDLEYDPYLFTLVRGIPVKWRIDGTNALGCGQVITIPKLGITEYLSTEEVTEIEFTPEELGSLSFSCTMGMTTQGAKFEVIEQNA